MRAEASQVDRVGDPDPARMRKRLQPRVDAAALLAAFLSSSIAPLVTAARCNHIRSANARRDSAGKRRTWRNGSSAAGEHAGSKGGAREAWQGRGQQT